MLVWKQGGIRAVESIDPDRLSDIVDLNVESPRDEVESNYVHLHCEAVEKAHQEQDCGCPSVVWLGAQTAAHFISLGHEKPEVDHFRDDQDIADDEGCRYDFQLESAHSNEWRTEASRFVAFVSKVLVAIVEHVLKLAALRQHSHRQHEVIDAKCCPLLVFH